IRNTLLISVAAGLARVQENVRAVIDLAQSLLRNEAGERHALRDLQFARQRLEFTEQRPFACNRQRCVWVLTNEDFESAKGYRQTFFLDQSPSLHESPFAVFRDSTVAKCKFLQRNSGALDLNLLRVAAEIDDSTPERLRPNENQLHCVEHLQSRFSISRLVHVHHDISAVE